MSSALNKDTSMVICLDGFDIVILIQWRFSFHILISEVFRIVFLNKNTNIRISQGYFLFQEENCWIFSRKNFTVLYTRQLNYLFCFYIYYYELGRINIWPYNRVDDDV